MKKWFTLLLLIFTVFTSLAWWSNVPSEITIFTSASCPHCANAKDFLTKLQWELKQENNIIFDINDYNISKFTDKAIDFYERFQVPSNQKWLIPAIFVWEKFFIGFNDQIENQIKEYILNNKTSDNEEKKMMKLPIFWEVDLLSFSLPVLALTLGVIDWFNVCSLWALLVILGLVMVLQSRKRIFFLWWTFLLTTAIMYALLIFLWHQFFVFIAPFIKSLEIIIGILAIGGWIYLLREFYKAYKFGPICGSNNLMSRLVPKIEKIFKEKTNRRLLTWVVVIFATIVTVIEFPCSAFLPVLFTSILVDADISFNISLIYIAMYMVMYLLDEIIIFAIAVITLRIKIVSPKFIIFFNLLAALIFIGLGIYYITKIF